jgi:hypothetical protein
VTADKDFGELVFRQGLVHSGVMGAFSVVSPGQVRIRRSS